jgi:hypothetical protein
LKKTKKENISSNKPSKQSFYSIKIGKGDFDFFCSDKKMHFSVADRWSKNAEDKPFSFIKYASHLNANLKHPENFFLFLQ